MAAHAVLSPSGSSRWLACTPSARLEEKFPRTSSAAAEEGTLAHELCELYLRNHFKMVTRAEYKTDLKRIKNNQYFNLEMDGHAVDYTNHIIEKFHQFRDGSIFVEERVDLTGYVPLGFGTVDGVLVGDGILDINDLKYGKGVLVEAQGNTQLMLYALGCLRKYSLLYGIETVRMNIWQPRLQNYSSYELSAGQLIAWGKTYVKPRARLAFDGQGERVAGDHCKFCKVRNTCVKLRDQQMELAKHAFKDPENLTEEQIAEVLEKAPTFKSWISSVEAHALHEAIHNGVKYPGHKLVRGRSNRVLSQPDKIMAAFKKGKVKAALYTTAPKLLGIGALEKNLGKDKVAKLAGKYIIKPEGAPTLVPTSDKRVEMKSAEDAAQAFTGIQTNK